MEREKDIVINNSLHLEDDHAVEEASRATGRDLELCSDGEALSLYE
jgi:hypothetical protein